MSTRMLYRYPGSLKSSSAKTGKTKVNKLFFDYLVVDEEEIEVELKRGWHITSTEALSALAALSKEAKKETKKKEDETIITIALTDLKDLDVEQIKKAFVMDELRLLAKSVKIKGFHNMLEDNLVKKLLEKLPKE